MRGKERAYTPYWLHRANRLKVNRHANLASYWHKEHRVGISCRYHFGWDVVGRLESIATAVRSPG